MTIHEYLSNYWSIYTLLEKEVRESLQYVELDVRNFPTFSQQFVKLLLQIGSEVDNVLREMCGVNGRSDISTYTSRILDTYPNLTSQIVFVLGKEIQLVPFKGWNTSQPSQSLQFWFKYNKVKHDRSSNIQDASLETVLNATAALFALELYRYKELYDMDANAASSVPEEESKLFYLDSWTWHIRPSSIKASYCVVDDERNTILL